MISESNLPMVIPSVRQKSMDHLWPVSMLGAKVGLLPCTWHLGNGVCWYLHVFTNGLCQLFSLMLFSNQFKSDLMVPHLTLCGWSLLANHTPLLAFSTMLRACVLSPVMMITPKYLTTLMGVGFLNDEDTCKSLGGLRNTTLSMKGHRWMSMNSCLVMCNPRAMFSTFSCLM